MAGKSKKATGKATSVENQPDPPAAARSRSRKNTTASHDDDTDPKGITPSVATSSEPAKGTPTSETTTKTSSNSKWDSASDAILVDELVRCKLDEGLATDSGFKPVAWQRCADALAGNELETGGGLKTKDACKSRYYKIRNAFCMIQEMLKHSSGFGTVPSAVFNQDTCMIVASDDVWEARIKAKAELKQYRNTGFPLYNQMLILVENVVATGENAYRPGSRAKPKAVAAPESTDEFIDTSAVDDIEEDGDDNQTPTKSKGRVPATPDSTKPTRAKPGSSANPALMLLASSMGQMAEAFVRESAASSTASSVPTPGNSAAGELPPSPVRRTRAIQLLEEDDLLPDDQLLKAIKLFEVKTAIADSFLAIKKQSLRTSYIKGEIVAAHS